MVDFLTYAAIKRNGLDPWGRRVMPPMGQERTSLGKRQCPLYPRKRTLRWALDMFGIVLRKVLKRWGHHETSPQAIFASGRERCRASGLAAYRERTNLSNTAGAYHRRISSRQR